MTDDGRVCTKCGIFKPRAMFNVRARFSDRLKSECKSCEAARYQKNKERIRAKQKAHWAVYRERVAESRIEKQRDYRSRTAARQAAYKAEYKKLNRPKFEAKNAVQLAILSGRLLKQPCEVCGAPVAHAHHDDYAKPLSVRWLCRRHHAIWHAENGEAPNGRTIMDATAKRAIIAQARAELKPVAYLTQHDLDELAKTGRRAVVIYNEPVSPLDVALAIIPKE